MFMNECQTYYFYKDDQLKENWWVQFTVYQYSDLENGKTIIEGMTRYQSISYVSYHVVLSLSMLFYCWWILGVYIKG